jgi:serine protease
MSRRSSPHRAARIGLAFLLSLGVAAGLIAVAGPASAAGAANPFSPAYGHPYRHGAIPTRTANNQMRSYQAAHSVATPDTADNLSYRGGGDGIGVTTGAEKVYLVFWGSQWGSSNTDGNNNTTLSGDPSHMAPRLQQLMKGLGVNNEQWSVVMTQYCEGVAAGAQTCLPSAPHVGYPTGGAFAGIWVDTRTAAPGSANGHQIAFEAVEAATHFGNTAASANRNAQYVIVSPHGTTPDGFNAGAPFCAWHDWNGDSRLTGGAASSSVGDIAFTNLPYLTDVGADCGQGFVNSGDAGTLDGVTIVEGHEYAETITDQTFGGWVDSSGNENGDKCIWLRTGPGASANVAFSTGSFAMQSTWSNRVSGCQTIAGPPARLVALSGDGELVPVRQNIPAPVVQVQDANGAGVANVPVTFTVSGRASLADGGRTMTVMTDLGGQAMCGSLRAGNVTGTATITASSDLLAPITFTDVITTPDGGLPH